MDSTHFLRVEHLSAGANILLFHQGRFLCAQQSLYWDSSISARLADLSMPLIALGERDGIPCVGAILDKEQASEFDCEHISARRLLTEIDYEGVDFATSANQLLHWLEHHRYCGVCGSPTKQHLKERALICPECDAHFYPRINPCVIVLVTKGDKMLLARNAQSKLPFFSCLAGFMEAGETPEETVAREVFEEVGIQIKNVRYVKSQSWPFPSQLMLGFLADYDSGEIKVDGIEIAEADWFDKDNRPPRPNLPRPIKSVAADLVAHFIELQNQD